MGATSSDQVGGSRWRCLQQKHKSDVVSIMSCAKASTTRADQESVQVLVSTGGVFRLATWPSAAAITEMSEPAPVNEALTALLTDADTSCANLHIRMLRMYFRTCPAICSWAKAEQSAETCVLKLSAITRKTSATSAAAGLQEFGNATATLAQTAVAN